MGKGVICSDIAVKECTLDSNRLSHQNLVFLDINRPISASISCRNREGETREPLEKRINNILFHLFIHSLKCLQSIYIESDLFYTQSNTEKCPQKSFILLANNAMFTCPFQCLVLVCINKLIIYSLLLGYTYTI